MSAPPCVGGVIRGRRYLGQLGAQRRCQACANSVPVSYYKPESRVQSRARPYVKSLCRAPAACSDLGPHLQLHLNESNGIRESAFPAMVPIVVRALRSPTGPQTPQVDKSAWSKGSPRERSAHCPACLSQSIRILTAVHEQGKECIWAGRPHLELSLIHI